MIRESKMPQAIRPHLGSAPGVLDAVMNAQLLRESVTQQRPPSMFTARILSSVKPVRTRYSEAKLREWIFSCFQIGRRAPSRALTCTQAEGSKSA
jgi:hypothetical protein